MTIPANTFPRADPIELFVIVSKTGGDDHLGQGPDFQAEATVETASVNLIPDGGRGETSEDERDDTSGEARRGGVESQGAALTTVQPRVRGIYLVPFTAR